MSSLLEDISEIKMRTYQVDYKDSTGELQRSVFFFNTERHISDLIASYLMTVASIDLDDVEDTDLAVSSYTDHQFYGHLIPYISYIQERFARCTSKSKKGIFYNKDLDVYIRVKVNSAGTETSKEPLLETFKLVKWFIEINTTKQVSKELMECIEQEEAIEMLGN